MGKSKATLSVKGKELESIAESVEAFRKYLGDMNSLRDAGASISKEELLNRTKEFLFDELPSDCLDKLAEKKDELREELDKFRNYTRIIIDARGCYNRIKEELL